MKKEYKQLQKLIEKSQNILILTHKSPDFDAFCSSLILKKFLNTHYPKKNVVFKARQSPTQNIPFMHEIQIFTSLDVGNEELVILTDSGGWNMIITEQDTINLTKAKLAIIDHHDTTTDISDVSINNNMSSATEQVIDFCKKIKGRSFKITAEIAKLGQIGIVADTGRFLYDNATPQTYELMAELRKVYPVDLDEFEYKNNKFPMEALLPLKIFIQNIHIKGDMAFTFVTNKEIDEYKLSKPGVNHAQQFLRDNIIRYIQGVHWGFVVKPSYMKENEWQVSFRGTKGYQKVDKLAEALNGGGHEYSSACKITANDGDEAAKIVLNTISPLIEKNP